MPKQNLTFDKYLGVKLVKVRKGYCKVKLQVKPSHLNHGGILHGGVIATICDIVLAGAVGTVLEKNEWCVTAELSIKYLYPVFPRETIFGYAQIVKKGATLAFVEGGIKSKDKLVARAHGIWAIKSRPRRDIKGTKSLG